jgi:hypothetical protein
MVYIEQFWAYSSDRAGACIYLPEDISQNRDRNVAQVEYIMQGLFRILKPDGMLIVSGVSFQASNLRLFEISLAYCSSGKEAPIFFKNIGDSVKNGNSNRTCFTYS